MELEIPGVDRLRVRRVDEGMYPHLIIDAAPYELSILAEVDFNHPDFPSKQPWPFLPGVVEIGLLRQGESGLVGEPLRRVPLNRASWICDRVIKGNVSDFEDDDDDE